jgi:metal iron transporter
LNRISAGASFRYDLLCVVFIANVLAIFLQTLCLRLGTVTGRDLAQNSRERLPRWLNIIGYLFAEAAILCTDLAEVIGTAIALNMLSHGRIPLPAGVALTMTDVVIILFFYNRTGSSISRTQIFELGVTSLVIGVTVCFSIELSKVQSISVGDVFHGFLPSKTMIHGRGLYVSCGIIGSAVGP